MPKFRLKDEEIKALSGFLSVQKAKPIETYKINPAVVAAWSKKPDLLPHGEVRFRQMMCTTCHPLAVTRAGETKLIGGNIGPELTKVGSKVNEEWLVSWLRNPQGYLAHNNMPRYGWSDEDLYKVSQYVMNKLTDSDLLANRAATWCAPPTKKSRPASVCSREKGCASCHGIEGVGTAKRFWARPDGARREERIRAGVWQGENRPQPALLYSGQVAGSGCRKSCGTHAAIRLESMRILNAVTTALLSQTGPKPTSALQHLMVPKKRSLLPGSRRFCGSLRAL